MSRSKPPKPIDSAVSLQEGFHVIGIVNGDGVELDFPDLKIGVHAALHPQAVAVVIEPDFRDARLTGLGRGVGDGIGEGQRHGLVPGLVSDTARFESVTDPFIDHCLHLPDDPFAEFLPLFLGGSLRLVDVDGG